VVKATVAKAKEVEVTVTVAVVTEGVATVAAPWAV
jgi:uncharacterized protein GlcG (DUF336 family)